MAPFGARANPQTSNTGNGPQASGNSLWTTLSYAPASANNPLKGFMPYAGDYGTGGGIFPHSMEFFYMGVNEVMFGPNKFVWAALDEQLQEIAARGDQAVFRFYLDYPDKPSGIPDYLINEGLKVNGYTDYGNTTSASPNYEDPRLRAAMVSFIKALGKRYDGDPRIGFIQVGLIGFWGEWQTYPHQDWTPSLTTDDLVLQTFVNAFPKTKLLVRQPVDPITIYPVGYHDDSFAYDTISNGNGNFMDLLSSYGLLDTWKTQAIGGELRPELQNCIWGAYSCAQPPQTFGASVDATHASWLLNQFVFSEKMPSADEARALAGARSLGYELTVPAVSLPAVKAGAPITVSVRVRNTGCAPFYYNWPVELALVSKGKSPVATWTTTWHLDTILPGQPDTQLSSTLAHPSLKAGQYKVLLRVANPMAGGNPLRFANRTQDATISGWLTLGQMTIS